ncbi:hypothetical protein TorRG33x02_035100, partial [Trema orientale]
LCSCISDNASCTCCNCHSWSLFVTLLLLFCPQYAFKFVLSLSSSQLVPLLGKMP